MTDLHTPLLEKIQKVLEADSRVLAAWLEGSIARKEEDDLSDIDLWICVADSDFESFMADREIIASKIGPVLSILYPKTVNQLDELDSFQVLFDDQPITCHLDVDVQKKSRGFVFTEGSLAEECQVLFDRGEIIQHTKPDATALEAERRELAEYILTQFWHRIPQVMILLEREQILAAMDSYRDRLHDLVTLYRILYTPEKIAWGWKDCEADLPKQVVHILEQCTPELTVKSLNKRAIQLVRECEKVARQLHAELHIPLPTQLMKAVNEVV